MSTFYESATVGATALSKNVLVKLTANLLVVTAADTDDAFGMVVDAKAISASARVAIHGCTFGTASGTITQFDLLMPAAAGAVKTHDGGTDSPIIGYARETVATGEYVEVYLYANKAQGPAA